MFKTLIAILSALLLSVNGEFTKLQWSSCGTSAAAVSINFLDATPMVSSLRREFKTIFFYLIFVFFKPIFHPGDMTLSVKASSKRLVQGDVKTDMNIIRTVVGLALPVRCTIVQGLSVGSCSYKDACKNILNELAGLDASNCPVELAAYGIDCTCPFNIPTAVMDEVFLASLEDLSTSPVSFLATGDFDVTIKAADARGEALCLNVKFTMKKKL
jgi:hypothetical protein